MARNLILTGGVFHPFETSTPALAALLAQHGIESTATEDIEAGLRSLATERHDLLTVYALRWRMLDHEKYQPYRARWAISLSAEGRGAIRAHLERGGGLLAMHTATICFDDWPEWKSMVGGAWVWGQSSHLPHGAAKTRLTALAHPITAGLEGFALDDEVYGRMDLEPDVQPLMEALRTGDPAGWQPVLWARQFGSARIAYDALGHDATSLNHPVHRRIVARAALWALGRSDREIATL